MDSSIVYNDRSSLGRKLGGNDDCLGRIPYASVMAFFMCAVGVILFAVMMVWAFNASVEQSRRILNIDHLPFLSKIHVFFLVVTVIMGLIALVLLTVGAMSTGATRKEFFRGVEGRMGGKSANIIAMVLGYLSNLFCLFGFASTAVLCFVYYVFDRLCSQITDFSDSSCLDFTVYEPLLNKPLKLCGGDLQQFCVLSSTAYIWYIVGFIGCLITILGLQHFLMCSAANYSRVSFGMRAEELKELVMCSDVEALNTRYGKEYFLDSDRRTGFGRPYNYYQS